MQFPTLYGTASNGKRKVWQLNVESRDGVATIVTTHGYENGKKQTTYKTISKGKNIGKSNETTPLQQAVADAQAAWNKKKDTGYLEEGTVSTTIPSPMLAHDFNKRSKSIIFPCYTQRKYDGARCIGVPQQGLFSRTGKKFPNLDHILQELNQFQVVFDGELYSGKLTFQELIGRVKRDAANEDQQKQVEYHIYDLIEDTPYEERMLKLQKLFQVYTFQYLRLVPTDVCENVDDMKRLHAQYSSDGYEGLILRNKDGRYKAGYRSVDLQKYKEFVDAEFEISDFKEGEGLEAGCVVWICKTLTGATFACRPRGTREDRSAQFKSGFEYIGKQLTVRYQELTDGGIPRFPVGIAIRDYE
jgi:ATP-dependent DNA ligase